MPEGNGLRLFYEPSVSPVLDQPRRRAFRLIDGSGPWGRLVAKLYRRDIPAIRIARGGNHDSLWSIECQEIGAQQRLKFP